MFILKIKSKTWVYLWVIIYITLWTYVSYSLDPTVPYDAVEAVNWGMNYEWGSPKNPWFVGMIMWPAILFNFSYSFYWYLIHFIAIGIGMIGVWQLTYYLSKQNELAWFALLLLNLSGVINFDMIPYNDNYILISLWPWMLFLFIRAIYVHSIWWLGFAFISGLATMTKYSTLSLMIAIFILTILIPKIRQCYQQIYFYIALIIWFLLILPNIIWLIENNFSSFKWVTLQIKSGFNLHILNAIFSVFYILIIAIIIIYRLGGKISWPILQPNKLINFILLFPLTIIFIWFLFHDGERIIEWLQPFIIIAIPSLIGSISIPLEKSLHNILFSLIIFSIFVILGYYLIFSNNINGYGQKMIGIKTLVLNVQQRWQIKYNRPLKYIGGEDSLYQWFIIYASDRPNTIQPWDNTTNPPSNIYFRNITNDVIKKNGALLLGKISKNCSEEKFSSMLKYWPSFSIEKENVLYQSEPYSKVQHLCLGFISPTKS